MTHAFFRLLATLTLVLLPTMAVFAVGVKPLRTELHIHPGASATATLTIINPEQNPQRVSPEVVMYESHDLAGFPRESDIAADDPTHVANWITFSERDLVLAPGESRDVTITVRVPRDAEPGGRYGSLVYAPVVDATSSTAVQLQPRVASLLLITVSGNEIRSGDIHNFSLEQGELKSDEPLSFAVHFKNTGTVHVKPAGFITLFDESDTQLREVARYIDPETREEVIADAIPVNLSGGNVLPGSERVFRGLWNHGVMSGDFRAQLSFGTNGGGELTRDFSFSFDDSVTITKLSFVPRLHADTAGFRVTLQNDGTVHQRLGGTIDIFNAFQFKVAEVSIPDDLPYVAPGERMQLDIPWMSGVIPGGSYEAVLHAKLGLRHEPVEYRQHFRVGMDWLLVAGLGALGGGAIAGAAYVFVRRTRAHATQKNS